MSTDYQFKNNQKLRGNVASYKIIKPMEGGGHGETYKAKVFDIISHQKNIKKNQEVVIKIPRLKEDLSFDDKMDRLLKITRTLMIEVSLLKPLNGLHCVASVLDNGTYQHKLTPKQEASIPALFIVQELISGEQLGTFMTLKFGSSQKFTGIPNADDFLTWSKKLTYCLLNIHQRQIVHGDIWPNNIMVNSKEEAVLIDFGQAIFRELSCGPTGREGASHPFVAPEGSGSVGADIYSLGGVLFYLAAGKNPPIELKQIKDIDELKAMITSDVKHNNSKLYEDNCGVIDVITRCLRYSQHDRIPHAEGLLQDIETFSIITPSDTKIKAIPTLLKKLDNDNPLFAWMARLRLRLLSSGIEDMSHGVYDLIGDHETLVNGLTQYVSFLQTGDQYLTVSLPRFWNTKNIGINGRFLTMNKLAALHGATIRRIFLITPEDKLNPEVSKIINSHCTIMEELAEKKINTINPELTAGGYYTGVKEIDKNLRDKMYKERGHFGLLVKKKKEILIFPIYREDDTLVAIQFRARADFGQSLRVNFDELLRKSTPIQEYSIDMS